MRSSRPLSINATSQLGPQFAVLRLHSWPDLKHISQDLIPDVVRVCALLAIRPTGAPLIHRLVNIPRERTQHVVDMLHLHGHLSSGTPVEMPLESPDPAQGEAGSANEKSAPVIAFLDRLRHKLLSAGAR